MAFPLPSHLPRKVDVSSEILTKFDSATWKTLNSSVATSWCKELDECISQTKRRIHDRIRSDITAFDAQLSSAKSAQERLSNLSRGINSLSQSVFDSESGVAALTLETLKQHHALAQASLNADVLHASLQHLEKCKAQLDLAQMTADTGNLPEAVRACSELNRLLAASPGPLTEANVIADVKRVSQVIENRVSELLEYACSVSLTVVEQHITVRPSVLVPGSATPLPLSSVLSSLSPSVLAARLASLRRDLTSHYIDRILRGSTSVVSITEDDPSGFIIHKIQCLTPNDPVSHDTSLDSLSRLLDFLDGKVFPHLPQHQRESFPRTFAKPVTSSVMTNLLIPSLPLTLQGLPPFLQLTRKAVDFESKYVVGLLGGGSMEREIKAWADSVCAHYERARRVRILGTIRNVILEHATRIGDTFVAEIHISPGNLPYDQTTVADQQDATECSPSSGDPWNLDDRSFSMSHSGSAVDEQSWGFDDEIEQSGQTATVSGLSLEAKADPDPGDAWGWNDDEPPEEPAGEEAGTDSSHAGLWDDDPWGNNNDSSTYPSAIPSVAGAVQSQKLTPEQQVARGSTNGPSKASQDPSRVSKDRYLVSTLTTEVVRTVENCLEEGKALSTSHIFPHLPTSPPGNLIMHSGSLVFELYCGLYPVVAASRLSDATLHVQFSNDCYYLSEELGRVLSKAEAPSDVEGKLQEIRADLMVLAESWFYDAIDKQVTTLCTTLASADGFTGTSDQDRYDECETSVTTVLQDIKRLARSWKHILPKGKYYIAVGNVVDGVLSRILDDVLAIPDIPEVESHKLGELCRILSALEELFVENAESLVVSFVPLWLKFSYLSELLEASMADLTYLFDEGALVDFEIDELVKLVRALFADTPLRTKTLDKIMGGHPIRS
ncbi:hypothetical protein EDC04DRAFT_2670225 [Pisolithus marmoratus]|nr:hypothetical protein EDC04DRAFT_2670225 [Pisolithus marmoratus]